MIYLFEVKIKPGHRAEQYADAWVRASQIIQQAPGAMGTRLHRSLSDPNRLIAIASWASKKQRDAMESEHDSAIDAIIQSAAPFCEISVIGEFDDPEWMVLPPS